MIKLMDLITEGTSKDGFEAIKQFTYGKPTRIQAMTKGNWLVHHPKGIKMGVGKNRYCRSMWYGRSHNSGVISCNSSIRFRT